MDDLEHRLREAALSRPSAAHDAAMQRIFADAQLRRPPFWSTTVALWKSAAACALCLSFGYLLHAYVEPTRPQSEPASAVYIIPPDPALSGLFDATQKKHIPALDAGKMRVRIAPVGSDTASTHKGSI
jgi:hypothetical protein